jgi:hypothetical protein
MTRTLVILAAFALPAVPALAQSYAAATPGAIAGRSPAVAYRQTDAAPGCQRQMHSLPAGKLPTYGTHALPQADCAQPLLASTKPAAIAARD